MARGQRIGNPDAPVQVVEFTDFECPFCMQFHADYWPQLASKYGANLSLVVRHYPLPIHPNAYLAAKAVECAAAAKKFEEMFVALRQYAGSLNDSVMVALQASVGVSQDQRFVDCWTAATNSSIETDRRLARDIGLTGTPTLIINGTRLRGLPTYAMLDSIVATKLLEVRQ
jgi:protein-disulfide isomerase